MTGFNVLGVVLAYVWLWIRLRLLNLIGAWWHRLIHLTVAEFAGHHGRLSEIAVLVHEGTRVHRVILAIVARIVVEGCFLLDWCTAILSRCLLVRVWVISTLLFHHNVLPYNSHFFRVQVPVKMTIFSAIFYIYPS